MPKAKNTQLNKTQKQVIKEKPEWVTSFVDQDKFRLSQAELMQKKVSLISKHRIEAKQEWSNLQKKLASGVQDDETKKIYDTVSSIKRQKYDVQRKNLSQMIELQKTERINQKENVRSNNNKKQDESPKSENILQIAKNILNNNNYTEEDNPVDLITQVKSDLEDTRNLINKVDKYRKKDKNFENPEKLLFEIQNINKNQTPLMSEKKKKPKSEEINFCSDELIQKAIFNDEKQMIQNSKKYPIFSQLDNIEQTIDFLQDYKKTTQEKKQQNQEMIERNTKIQIQFQSENKSDNENVDVEFDDSGNKNEIERCSFELSAQSNSNMKKSSIDKIETQITKKLDLDQLSPSKFFKQENEYICKKLYFLILYKENNPKAIDLSDQDENVEALRKLLEQTRIELEKMNINNTFNSFLSSSEFCQEELNKKSINIGQVKTFQILGPHVYQSSQQQNQQQEYEEEINPRQLNVIQQDLKKTVNQFSKKYKNSKNSFNLTDNLMKNANY